MSLARTASGFALAVALAGCAAETATSAPAAGERTAKPALAAPSTLAPTQPAAPASGVALVNPGFESTAAWRNGAPEGWFTFQHAGDKSYEFSVDTADPRSGTQSLRIQNIGPEPYGAIAQAFDARPYVGKTARYSAWLRTRDASEAGAVLTLMALQVGVPQAHNFMAEAPVKGTTGWQRYTITLPIPRGAERIEIGAMMQGKGTLWLDDAELQFVDN